MRLPRHTTEIEGFTFRFLIFVIMPLVVGCATYVFLREKPPFFLQGFPDLYFYRVNCTAFETFLCNSDFLKYSLPDAAWAFSFTSLMALLVKNEKIIMRLMYMASTIALVALSELSQLYVPIGTFDELDLIAELAAATIASIISVGEQNEKARR
jgi:hypothetical protein